MTNRRCCFATILILAAAVPAQAQQNDVQWKQTVNMPKGQNMPQGVKADLLGIELGDSYAEAKAKLEKLEAEGIQRPKVQMTDMQRSIAQTMGELDEPPIVEQKSTFNLQSPGASSVTAASFVAQIRMRRSMRGAGKRNISETVAVRLSAPASGSQVLGIERHISYFDQGDEPRISELLAQLRQKFKAEPQVYDSGSSTEYRFQFNNGAAFKPANANISSCRPEHDVSNMQALAGINRTGECDIVLSLSLTYGMSRDHARSLRFILSDNERAKSNRMADFAYVRDYVQTLQQRSGAQPKL